MKTIDLTLMMAAVGVMAVSLPHSAFGQNETSTPTIPENGIGGPHAVDVDPIMAQAKPTEKMGKVPRTNLTIPEIIDGASDFTTLAGALRAAGLIDMLKGDGPFTLLAPDNDAFAALPAGVLKKLLKPENKELLKKVIGYHVIAKKVTSKELIPGSYNTAEGEMLMVVGRAEGDVTIQGSGFGSTDIMAGNGIIHVVKGVLLPPKLDLKN